MANNAPDLSSLARALPEGTIPPSYAPLLHLLQSMLQDDDPDEDTALRKLESMRRRLHHQAKRLARAERAIRAYRAQNILLARAHGACECWGGDADCTVCAGRGAAGWTRPDEKLLHDLVGFRTGDRWQSSENTRKKPQPEPTVEKEPNNE